MKLTGSAAHAAELLERLAAVDRSRGDGPEGGVSAAAETGRRVVSGLALPCVVGGVTTALVTVLRAVRKVARLAPAHFPPVAKALDFAEDRLGSIALTRPESAIAGAATE